MGEVESLKQRCHEARRLGRRIDGGRGRILKQRCHEARRLGIRIDGGRGRIPQAEIS